MVADTGSVARRISSDDPSSALALAEEVLGRAQRVGATEAEVLVVAGDAALTRFANSEIHQNVAERSVLVNLRYIVGRRIAVVSTGSNVRRYSTKCALLNGASPGSRGGATFSFETGFHAPAASRYSAPRERNQPPVSSTDPP